MNQEDLHYKNDLLSQISSLKASIKVLKLDEKKNKSLIKNTEKIIKEIEVKLKEFEEEVVAKRERELKEQQERRVQENLDDLAFLNEYLQHVGTLGYDELPDEEMSNRFFRLKNRPHIVRQLKLRLLK